MYKLFVNFQHSIPFGNKIENVFLKLYTNLIYFDLKAYQILEVMCLTKPIKQ